jgi:hypothetical protein
VQTTKETLQYTLFAAHIADFIGETVLSIDCIRNVSPVITRIAFGVESQIDNLGGISRLDVTAHVHPECIWQFGLVAAGVSESGVSNDAIGLLTPG